jgi:hypothetical protein
VTNHRFSAAAGDAAGDALKETVATLQISALDLVERMISMGDSAP